VFEDATSVAAGLVSVQPLSWEVTFGKSTFTYSAMEFFFNVEVMMDGFLEKIVFKYG
jgi:hypothetical protein